MKYTYIPKGVCSQQIILDVENGIVNDLKVIGGCDGNLKGITSLVKGMQVLMIMMLKVELNILIK